MRLREPRKMKPRFESSGGHLTKGNFMYAKASSSSSTDPKAGWMSPMRGDVKEKYSLLPLREEMDVAIGIQPNLRSGEALCSRRASHRPRQSTVSARRFHNLMVRRLRFGSYASKPGWL